MRALSLGLALLACLATATPHVQAAYPKGRFSYHAAKTVSYAPDGNGLGPVESAVYEQLRSFFQEVAEGKRTSTVFTFQVPYTASELANADLNLVITYLLADCPFDLFWHDKTRTIEAGEGTDGVYCYYQQDGTVEFKFKVSVDYRGSQSNLFEVDPSKIARSGTARQTALGIVEANKGLSDYEKLKAYRDAICNMVEYDYGAASGTRYGDGHQLVNALDNNPGTNVVCEGYAKAFKYLCDLSAFQHDVKCYLVSGVSDAGNGAGDHMWNIVRVGGSESYLVDVTNCDAGTIGADYELFLTDAAKGSVSGGYTFLCHGRDAITYYYDASSLSAYGPTILSLSNGGHGGLESLYPAQVPADMPTPTVAPQPKTEPEPEEKPDETPGTAAITFTEDTVYKTYGDEPFALDMSDVPEGTTIHWQSSDDSIATVVDGKVHILKPGMVTIKADAGVNLATCTLVIEKRQLTWDTSGLYAADPGDGWDALLTGELAIDGILEQDMDADAKFRFGSDDLSGIFSGQKVSLNWKEGRKWALTGAKADYYELPDLLPDIEGRLTATQVLDKPPESTEEQPLKLEMEPDLATVPEALLDNESLNTPDKIISAMEDALSGSEGTSVSQVFLQYLDDSGGWIKADADTFPKDGITVTIPYPAGTSGDTQDFIVCHMFGEDSDEYQAGDLEYPKVTKTEKGLQFKVYSLSPIAVGWKDVVTETTSGSVSEIPATVMGIGEILFCFGFGFTFLGLALVIGLRFRR